jgi:phosphatidylinositol-3-phosphatase
VRRLALLMVATAFAALAAQANAQTLPPIHHVFIIIDENESASTTFGTNSPAPYLSKTLRAEGAYLPNYYAVGHESNDNYIAMVSGQAPSVENQADCQDYNNLTPGTIGSYGQADGTGCIYPSDVPTIASQLQAKGLTWRDYNEDMGADPTRESSVCGHPGVGTQDGTQKATATDMYATRHDPFVYFHSIIDDTTLCDTHVVNLDQLPADLASASDTPNYVFITPDLCDDGHDSPCANGQAGGLAQADQFLRTWVPKITSSPAFLNGQGLLIVTFDEAATSDTSSCCGEIPGPNSPSPGITGPGGGDVGAVLLSPCIAPGTVSETPYNHYGMLRSVEDIFGLGHIGYAQLPGERSFGSDVFTRPCGPLRVRITAHKRRSRIRLRWKATGASRASYFIVQVRTGNGRWRRLRAKTRRKTLVFKGRAGRHYTFRVEAVAASGTYSPWATKRVAVKRDPGARAAGG